MKKIMLLTQVFAAIIFAGEIFDQSTIDKVCKTEGYLKAFETEIKCQEHFLENNKKVLESEKMKDISINEFIQKNFSKVNVQEIAYYNYISPNLSLNTRIQLHLTDKMFNEFKKQTYSKINYFNYSNKAGVFLGPSNAEELKDYLSKFNKEHILDKLNFERVVKFIDNNEINKNFYVYKTFPYRIMQEEHFKYEILAEYFKSFKNFKILSDDMKLFLINELKAQDNILIKLTICNTLAFWDVYDINYEDLKKSLDLYIEKNSFLEDNVTSLLIEEVIMSTRIKLFKNLLEESKK